MSSKFTKGALVWVKHPTDAWQPATVGEVLPKGRLRVFFANGESSTVRAQGNNPQLRTIRCDGDIELSKVGESEEEEEELISDDLTKMTQFITPAVLYSLHKSYERGRFYSKLGSGTVLALNPFKDVPDLFTLKTIQSYHSVSLSELQNLPAHVYAVAQNALVTLRASVGKVNQSIIVSGESGAGKTWTVRCLMRYLAEVGIEYKRRLSSTDLSCSPLKGFHSSPIRSSLKDSVSKGECGHFPNGDVEILELDMGGVNGLDHDHVFDDSLHGQEKSVHHGHGVNGDVVHIHAMASTYRDTRDNLNYNNNHECGSGVTTSGTSDSAMTNVTCGSSNRSGAGDGATFYSNVSQFGATGDSGINTNATKNNDSSCGTGDSGITSGAGDSATCADATSDSCVLSSINSSERSSMNKSFNPGAFSSRNSEHRNQKTTRIEGRLENHEEEDEEDNVDLDVSIQIVDRIERRILFSNPILEAFGNAHTLRNENSSRFGKYIQLQYDRTGTIVGAQLKTYLLEKTRAVRHDAGERSYHIFYQMLHGVTEDEKRDWKLPECPFPEDSLSNEDNEEKSCVTHSNDKTQEFEDTRTSMSRIGISEDTQAQIFKLLSSVLHLRLLSFEGTDDLQTPCTLDLENKANETSLDTAGELLGVEKEAIMKAITFREITAHTNRRKSIFHRPCTVEECKSRRDSLAKIIYELLFHWIVDRVGYSVRAPKSKWFSSIGLLDVYGFESFDVNSLEQLCINYANEKLQQHFVASFLREQQEEYLLEGVTWTHCDLTDNVECLLTLEAPRNSLFSLLNEECRLNRSNAGSQLKSRVESMFKGSRHIVQPRISTEAPSFSVVHYAGRVNYMTQDLIEKNKDEVPPEITQLLTSSENDFVYDLVNGGHDMTNSELCDLTSSVHEDSSMTQNKGKHRPTVLTRFKKSLDDLLETLGRTDCHYIRCIKPNKQSVPDVFDPQFVLDQLEACGVIETIRVCAPAHPNKMPYSEFLMRYGFLIRNRKRSVSSENSETDETPRKKKRRCLTNIDLRKKTCERIVRTLQADDDKNNNALDVKAPLQFGKTTIFMSSELFESLESARSQEIVKCTVTVQRAWRGFVLRRRCREERKKLIALRESSSSVIQRAWRNIVNIRRCRAERRAIVQSRIESTTRIQRCWRMYKRKKDGRAERKILICKRRRAATTIQAAFRSWRIRCKYKDLMDAWRQLKLIPEEDDRKILKIKLRALLGPQVATSPSPTYEAIKASFELPRTRLTSTPIRDPQFDNLFSSATLPSGISDTQGEKLTVFYDENISRKIVVKEHVILDDLDLDEDDLRRNIHPMAKGHIHGSPIRGAMGKYMDVDSDHETHPVCSTHVIKHAKIIRSKSTQGRREVMTPKVETPERSISMPRLPMGPGIIYAWHNRAVISMMTAKRPMSLSSDPLSLLEMRYGQSKSVLTTPISNLRSSRHGRSRERRGKHHHSDRHAHNRSNNQSASSFNRITPSGYTWSPGYLKKLPKSGSNCILKYADVAPRK